MAVRFSSSIAQSRKKTILALRTLLIVSAWAIFALRSGSAAMLYGHALFMVFAASTAVLLFLGDAWFSHTRFTFTLVVADTLMAAALLYGTRAADYGIFVVFFLMILMAAAGQSLKAILSTGTLMALGYLILQVQTGTLDSLLRHPEALLKAPLLLAASLFYGYFLDENQGLREAVARYSRQAEHYGAQVQKTYWETLQSLVNALDLRDASTRNHSMRVTAYALALSKILGVPEREWLHVERGALLHDIGKIGVSDTILLKKEPLTREDWETLKRHPMLGYQMVHGIPFLERATSIILHHHERFDGSGYPLGLRGEAIPETARIFAVADAMDAITSGRPYKEKQGWEEVDAALNGGSGKQFDPRVVRAYFHLPKERWESLGREVERQTGLRMPPSLQELTASLRDSRAPGAAPTGGFQGSASVERALPMKMLHGIVAGIESAEKTAAERSRILVVDDEEMVCQFLRKTLESEGYVVDVAHDMAGAIAVLEDQRYDFVILDYLLSQGDSKLLFERVRTLQPQLAKRLLFISGAPLEGGLAQFLSRVRAPFLRKPFEPEELISALRILDRPAS